MGVIKIANNSEEILKEYPLECTEETTTIRAINWEEVTKSHLINMPSIPFWKAIPKQPCPYPLMRYKSLAEIIKENECPYAKGE